MTSLNRYNIQGPGFIYFIRCNGHGRENEFKIGLSINPIERANQLYNTSTPYEMYVYRAVQVQNMLEFERTVHHLFNGHRINPDREWFNILTNQQLHFLGYWSVSDVSYDSFNDYIDVHISQLIDDCNAIGLYCREIDVDYMREKHSMWSLAM